MKSGDRIGGLVVDRLLGAGGMGEAWLARDEASGDEVVIKAIRTLDEDPERAAAFRSRLRREAKVLQRLDHPHVVRALDVLEDDDEFRLVLEHVDGVTFEAACADESRDLSERLLILSQVEQMMLYLILIAIQGRLHSRANQILKIQQMIMVIMTMKFKLQLPIQEA